MTTAEAAVRLAVMDQVLILTHVRPDGDTVGSAAALCQALREQGKARLQRKSLPVLAMPISIQGPCIVL